MQMEGSMPTPNDEQLYLDATQEVDNGTPAPALWAMALAEGDEKKARYRYIDVPPKTSPCRMSVNGSWTSSDAFAPVQVISHGHCASRLRPYPRLRLGLPLVATPMPELRGGIDCPAGLWVAVVTKPS